MEITLHNLKPKKGSRKKKRYIGRGGKRGTYSGRGQKGQRARTGGKKGLKIKGLKAMMQRIPKLRGFKSRHPRSEIINLDLLEKTFEDGANIDIQKMEESGLVKRIERGVKILARGKLTKKFIIKANEFSKAAEEAIKKAGGEAIKIK